MCTGSEVVSVDAVLLQLGPGLLLQQQDVFCKLPQGPPAPPTVARVLGSVQRPRGGVERYCTQTSQGQAGHILLIITWREEIVRFKL